jgi:hypothetical protein
VPLDHAAGRAGRADGDAILHGDLGDAGLDGHLGGLASVRQADLDVLAADHDRAADGYPPLDTCAVTCWLVAAGGGGVFDAEVPAQHGEFAGMGLCYRPPRAHVPVVRAGGGVVQPRQGGFVLK